MGFFDFLRRKSSPPPQPVTDADTRFDPVRRQALLARCGDLADRSRPRPLVTLAEFFEGNNDWGSIGYNLSSGVAPGEWYNLLKAVAARPDVHDVRIEVKDLEDPDGWPATDTVWIITSADADTVRGWLPENLCPDDVLHGLQDPSNPREPLSIPPGTQAFGLWYD